MAVFMQSLFFIVSQLDGKFRRRSGTLKEQMDGYTQYGYKRHLFRDNRQLSIFVNFCRKELDIEDILHK